MKEFFKFVGMTAFVVLAFLAGIYVPPMINPRTPIADPKVPELEAKVTELKGQLDSKVTKVAKEFGNIHHVKGDENLPVIGWEKSLDAKFLIPVFKEGDRKGQPLLGLPDHEPDHLVDIPQVGHKWVRATREMMPARWKNVQKDTNGSLWVVEAPEDSPLRQPQPPSI